jgi:hypothetical protein
VARTVALRIVVDLPTPTKGDMEQRHRERRILGPGRRCQGTTARTLPRGDDLGGEKAAKAVRAPLARACSASGGSGVLRLIGTSVRYELGWVGPRRVRV